MAYLVPYIFGLHYIGDFLLQPYWIKLQKNTSISVMLLHIIFYSLTLLGGLLFFFSYELALNYVGVNALLHLGVDAMMGKFITSNSSKLKIDPDETKPTHERLNVWGPIALLGFDQLMHQICLILTLPLL